MRVTPIPCICESCKCGIYTYDDSKICTACRENNHLSGAKRIEKTDSTLEKTPSV